MLRTLKCSLEMSSRRSKAKKSNWNCKLKFQIEASSQVFKLKFQIKFEVERLNSNLKLNFEIKTSHAIASWCFKSTLHRLEILTSTFDSTSQFGSSTWKFDFKLHLQIEFENSMWNYNLKAWPGCFRSFQRARAPNFQSLIGVLPFLAACSRA